MNLTIAILGIIAGIAAGVAAGFLLSKTMGTKHLEGAKHQAREVLQAAAAEADRLKREKLTEAKEEIFRLRQEVEREGKERRAELQRAERRLEQKEENLDKKTERVSHKEDELKARHEELDVRMAEAEALKERQLQRLEEIASLTSEEARDILFRQVEIDAQHVIGLRLRNSRKRRSARRTGKPRKSS